MAQWLNDRNCALYVLKLAVTAIEVPLGDKDHLKNWESPLKIHYYRKEHSVIWDKACYLLFQQ